jgi:hypothetical protein
VELQRPERTDRAICIQEGADTTVETETWHAART